MPDSPEQVTLVKDGRAIRVPIDQAFSLIREGYGVEGGAGRLAREEGELKAERAPGLFASTALGAARGLTFGLSDVAGNALGQQRYLREAREAHPIGSTVGNIGGGVAALALTGGASAEGFGARVAQSATQGAALNAGSYISDVALGDRELSGEGFVGAMGKGALWGTGAELGVSGASRGLTAAKRLFPNATKESVAAAENVASQEIAAARTDAESLRETARHRMRGIREEIGSDPRVRAEHEAVAADAARGVAADANPQAALEQAIPSPPALADKATEVAGRVAGKKAAQAIVPADEAAAEEPNELLRQLQATKQKLDQGASLGSMGNPNAIEDAVNAHVAKTHPEMEGIARAEKGMQAANDALDAWRGKYQGGMVDLQEMAPAARSKALREWAENYEPSTPTGESVRDWTLAPKSEQTPQRLGGGTGPIGKVSGVPEDVNAAARKLSAGAARTGYLDELAQATNVSGSGAELLARAKFGGAKAAAKTADEVYAAHAAGVPIDEQVKAAIRAKVGGPQGAMDLDHAIDALSRFESAHADLTDALGIHAPMSDTMRAQAYRGAQSASTNKAAEATARAAQQAERTPGALGKVAHAAETIGQAAEVLRMLGVNAPDPKDVPIVGPLLSLYLKAKVGARVLGKVIKSPEAGIAEKAATMRNKVQDAVRGALDAAASGAKRAAPVAIPTATALGHALFKAPGGKTAAAKTVAEAFAARSAELAEAQRPGAIEDAVQRQVGASDPAIVDSIVEATRRKLTFLDSKRPKPGSPQIGEQGWTPDKQRMAEWARYVDAADHPEQVFAQLGRGQMPSHEALETVKAVYPRLWQEAQMHAAKALAEGTTELPYAARVRLSVTFGVPFDSSVSAGFQQMLHAPPTAPPAPPAGAPTLKTDVTLSKASTNRVDRS